MTFAGKTIIPVVKLSRVIVKGLNCNIGIIAYVFATFDRIAKTLQKAIFKCKIRR